MRFILAITVITSGITLAKMLHFEPLALPFLIMATMILYKEQS